MSVSCPTAKYFIILFCFSAELLLQCPKLYGQGRLQKVHQAHSFWLNMLDSLYQSVVIFFMAYGVRDGTVFFSYVHGFLCFPVLYIKFIKYTFQAYSGSDVGMFEFGTTIVVSCMFTMLVHMAIEAKSWVYFYFA